MPSNVAPAAGAGFRTQRVPLTSAAVTGLSSRVLVSLDDNFKVWLATKNTPPLRIMWSSFPSSLDFQLIFREVHIAS